MTAATPLDRAALKANPLPPVIDGDKESKGRILILAGSRDVPGAALLAATAAMRAGAGKLSIATVESIAPHVAVAMPEAMVIGLPEHRDGGFAGSAVARIAELAADVDAVVAGPGMEPGGVCERIADALLESPAQLALDAALLHSLSPLEKHSLDRAVRSRSCCRTLANWPRCSTANEDEVEAEPLRCGHRAAELYRSIVLVKGVTSHVVHPDGRAWTYKGGAPGPWRVGQRRRSRRDCRRPARARRGAAQRLAVGRLAAWRSGRSAGEKDRPDRLPRPRNRRRNPGLTAALNSLAALCCSSSSPISRTTWMTLVDPAVPNGTPAITTIRSPPSAIRCRSAIRLRLGDHFLEIGDVAGVDRVDAPQQAEPPRGGQRRGHHQDRHRRPLARDPPRGRSRAGVADHRLAPRSVSAMCRAEPGKRVGGGRLGRVSVKWIRAG